MKIIIYIFLCLITTFAQAREQEEPLKQLSQLQWFYRVIILKGSQDALNKENSIDFLNKQLNANKAALQERDIAWFLIDGKRLHTNLVPPYFNQGLSQSFIHNIINDTLKPSDQAILIGKDGGVKRRQSIININELLDLIDTMPMRQQEMDNKG